MFVFFVVVAFFSAVLANEPSPFTPCNYTSKTDNEIYAYCISDSITWVRILSRSVADNGDVVYQLKHEGGRKFADEIGMLDNTNLTELHTPGSGRDLMLDLAPGSKYVIFGNARGSVLYATYCQQDFRLRPRDNPNSIDIHYGDNSLYTFEDVTSHMAMAPDAIYIVDSYFWTLENYPNLCDKYKQ